MRAILDMCQAVIRHDGRDLTTRQIASLLLIYTTDAPHTVNSLADQMNLPPSAMRCVVNRLAQLGLIACDRDTEDRRCIVANRTPPGEALLREIMSLEALAAS